ncbi:hypothetical protein ACIP2X_03250 [Streptomyces sp. NPDC089424]|uniref:hypothetical protein n=1 Tax=Streptomyces sp. NPDC089424 TaxID=3365917 RepID=UPI00380F3E60
MTMKNLVKRLPVVAASVALAGAAVLGAGGAASAATPERTGQDRGSYQERDDGHDALAVRHFDDRRGHPGTWRHVDDRRDGGWVWHHDVRYRWDGHRLHELVDGRWIDVTPTRHGEVDRWYVDQVLAFER